MPKQKKKAKKGLTLEQLQNRLNDLARQSRELDAKIQRLSNAKIGTVRII
jgi:chaperonin cofactor prefoldin